MRLNKVKNYHWRIFNNRDINIFEFIIEFKRHFGLRFIPTGFGYDSYPLFIFDFFFISLFITIPFFKNHNDKELTYGLYFYDYNEPHWLPDVFNLSFGKYYKEYDLFWHIKLYNREYETKKVKSLKLKNINNLKTKDTFKYSKIININNKDTEILYYKEIYIYKYKIFKWFIDKWSKTYYYFNIEFKENNKHLINDIMVFYENKNIEEMLKEYLEKNDNKKEA